MVFNKKVSMAVLISALCPLLWAQQASGAQNVEVFAQGRKYHSIREYRAEEKNKNSDSSSTSQKATDFLVQDLDEFQGIFRQAVRLAQHPLELTFIPGQIKNFYLEDLWRARSRDESNLNAFLSGDEGYAATDPFAHSYEILRQAGSNAGVDHIVENFTVGEDRLSPSKQVSAKDLAQELKESSAVYDGTLLLMSDQEKIRVMALEPLEGKADSHVKMRAQ